jgi:hypothetical protein
MSTESAEYLYIALPRIVVAELAQLPEKERNNLCTLSRVLHEYLAVQRPTTSASTSLPSSEASSPPRAQN